MLILNVILGYSKNILPSAIVGSSWWIFFGTCHNISRFSCYYFTRWRRR